MVKLILMLLFTIMVAKGEVYSLLPKTKGSFSNIPGAESASLIEPVEINNMPSTMEIIRINLRHDELLKWLKQSFKLEQLEFQGDFIRINGNDNGKFVDRLLIIPNHKESFSTAFKMAVPKNLPPPQWPSQLPPLPSGAQLKYVIKFPKHGNVIGEFSTFQGDGNQKLKEYVTILRNYNWQPVSGEHRHGLGGNGDIFIRSTPTPAILWINFNTNGQGYIFYRLQNHGR